MVCKYFQINSLYCPIFVLINLSFKTCQVYFEPHYRMGNVQCAFEETLFLDCLLLILFSRTIIMIKCSLGSSPFPRIEQKIIADDNIDA